MNSQIENALDSSVVGAYRTVLIISPYSRVSASDCNDVTFSIVNESGAFMANEDTSRAWGDESARIRREPPMYLMCATMFEPGSDEGLAELVKAKPRGMRKLHWRDMEVREKVRSIEDFHIEHIKPCDDEPRLWVPNQILGAIGDMFSGSEGTDKWGRYRDGVDRHISLYTVSA